MDFPCSRERQRVERALRNNAAQAAKRVLRRTAKKLPCSRERKRVGGRLQVARPSLHSLTLAATPYSWLLLLLTLLAAARVAEPPRRNLLGHFQLLPQA